MFILYADYITPGLVGFVSFGCVMFGPWWVRSYSSSSASFAFNFARFVVLLIIW